MQQVARSIQQKRKRDRLRNKIQSMSAREYSNSVRYYDEPVVPHVVLAHQFRHLNRYAYNKKEEISARQIYPISQALIYEPLRYNQLQAQYHRSKSLLEGNEFLNHYSEKDHKRRKQEYFQRIKAIEVAKKQQEQARKQQFQISKRSGRKKMRQSFVLPPIKPPKYSKRFSLFRVAGIAVYFICLTRRLIKETIKLRRQLCISKHKVYVREALQSMQSFYYEKVEKQITRYILLLQKKIKYPKYKTESEILTILGSFFSKINALPVPKPILQALSIICCSHSAFSIPFLFTEQLKRIPFLKEEGCTGSMTQEESLMVTACFIVIKMLCYNLFYRPWLVQDLFRKHQQKHINLRNKYKELRRVINHMGSLPYFIVIDNFLLDCPILRSQSEIDQLSKQGIITTITFMQVLPKDAPEMNSLEIDSSEQQEEPIEDVIEVVSGKTEKQTQIVSDLVDGVNLIAGQNRGFYQRIRASHEQEMSNLEYHINEWVTKVTLSVLDLSSKHRRERARGSIQ